MISLLNDALIGANHPPLGFLNPWLYSGGYKGLHDIVGGNNPRCRTPGFKAIKGMGPRYRFGNPELGLLKDLVLGGTKKGSGEGWREP